MIRRQTRLRREYLYRKALEAKDRQIYERKQELKEALECMSFIISSLLFVELLKAHML